MGWRYALLVVVVSECKFEIEDVGGCEEGGGGKQREVEEVAW